jgi:MHS family proline/betaine transporter-like MFS transporter
MQVTQVDADATSPENQGIVVKQWKVIVAVALGNGLEVFDFIVYSFFAGLIGKVFFPSSDPLTSLLLSVGTFGVGFFMRPLGAVIIGGYADRRGRRAAMTLTIWLMAAGTAAIGLCPSYAAIGIAAPLILIAGRLLQGFAAGGEIGAATTFLMESGSIGRRGFYVSWQFASQGAASLVGGATGLVLAELLSPAHLSAWGWRIPFLFGLLIAPVGYYVRSQLSETYVPPADTGSVKTPVKSPIVELMRDHLWKFVLSVLMVSSGTVSIYIFIYYMPSYLMHVMNLPPTVSFLSATLSATIMLIGAPLSGLWADRLKRFKPMLLTVGSVMTLVSTPVFMLITHTHNPVGILFATAIMSSLLMSGGAQAILFILEAFPRHLRASAFAISYAFAATIFGGTAQFVATLLIKATHNPMSVGWYVTAIFAVGWIATALFPEGGRAQQPSNVPSSSEGGRMGA